jgi:hypothetical protein
MHAVPAWFCEQSTQVVALAPHALPSLPGAQIPDCEQQPLAHALDAEQGAPHLLVLGSHIVPSGQSDVALQPHAPATHA